jgi:hypothetical protein
MADCCTVLAAEKTAIDAALCTYYRNLIAKNKRNRHKSERKAERDSNHCLCEAEQLGNQIRRC